ncbi:MAG: cobalt ECF transporter T component CbiQ [Nitriliruptoraceae bacterium]
MGAGHRHALYVHEHSAVHGLPAHVKVVATFAFTVVVATTPATDVVAFVGLAAVLVVVTHLARVPFGFLLPRLAVVTPFLLAAALLPFVASGPRVEVFGIAVAVEGVRGGFGLAARAVLGAGASLLLVATTEVPDLLRGLERLRVPTLLTQIAAFMIRYLEVIAGEVGRQRTAMTARGYDPRWLWQLRPLAAGLGTLFIRSYERGERVHSAMRARGFTGHMPRTVVERDAVRADWLLALALPLTAVVVRVATSLTGVSEALR